jgi:PKD repeat protein
MSTQFLNLTLRLFFVILFATSASASAQISWVRHDISGNLRGGYGLHAVDVNKDGRMDFLSASRDGIKWWRNGGNGQFSGNSIGSLEGAWSAFGADVDHDGVFAWKASGTASENCLLRISDAADGDPIDVSNATFAIGTETITVIAPNGGESVYDTSEYEIQWATAGPVTGVNLEYSLDNGATWLPIIANLANTGSYLWAVPDTLSDSCRIRIADAADGSPGDASDNTFRIVRLTRNHAPLAVIGGPYSAPRATPIIFNASQSSDPDGDSLSFTWDFGDGQTGSGVEVTHAYTNVQNYSATLTVSDVPGGVSIAHTEVIIYNRPPVADAAGPYYAAIDSVVNFDARASADPDGDSLIYVWSFGDSSAPYLGGAVVSHVYSDSGNYQVVLQVQDNFGGLASDTTTAIIATNQPPIVDIRASELSVISICADTYLIGLTIDQAYDADGSIVAYEWDFGDGSPHSNSSASLTHVFPVPGIYTVKLMVTDNQGAIGMDSEKILLNHDYAPVASFTTPKDTVLINTAINFNAGASQDHEGPIAGYTWNFGDGSIETSAQPTISHVYQTLGNVQVQLTVTDGCGNTGVASRTLRIALTTAVAEAASNPTDFGLAQNFPNPVSLNSNGPSATRITFNLPSAGDVQLSVYNLFGQRVRALVNSYHAPGNYTATWDLHNERGESVSSGIYFYRLQTANHVATKKLVVMQ